MTLTQRQDLATRIARVIVDTHNITGALPDTADVQSAIVHLLAEHELAERLTQADEVRTQLAARGDAPLTTDSSACTE